MPDETRGWLAVEMRDTGKVLSRFSTVDVQVGWVIRTPTSAPDPWWMSLYDAYDGLQYLHTYHPDSGGVLKGILALDGNTGDVLWEVNGLHIRGLLPDGVVVAPAIPDRIEELEKLDARTGERIYTDPQQWHAAGTALAEKRGRFNRYPIVYTPDNPHYQTVSAFIRQQLQEEAQGPVEYLEMPHHLVIGYHTATTQGIANFLVIFDHNGRLLERQRLGKFLGGYALDTFFVSHNHVVSVQDQTIIMLIDLDILK